MSYNHLSSNSSIALSLQIHQKNKSIWNELQTPKVSSWNSVWTTSYSNARVRLQMFACQQAGFNEALCSPAYIALY